MVKGIWQVALKLTNLFFENILLTQDYKVFHFSKNFISKSNSSFKIQEPINIGL
jgi:hypothetical protein